MCGKVQYQSIQETGEVIYHFFASILEPLNRVSYRQSTHPMPHRHCISQNNLRMKREAAILVSKIIWKATLFAIKMHWGHLSFQQV